MSFSNSISAGVVLAVQIIILGIYAIFALSCLLAKETVEEVNINIKEHTSYIKLLRVDAEMVAQNANDITTKEAFTKLAEQIKYSDPMSSEELTIIESELKTCIQSALEAVKRNDYEESMQCCRQAELLLAERNEKCKIYK